jgi:hypothetical protein
MHPANDPGCELLRDESADEGTGITVHFVQRDSQRVLDPLHQYVEYIRKQIRVQIKKTSSPGTGWMSIEAPCSKRQGIFDPHF